MGSRELRTPFTVGVDVSSEGLDVPQLDAVFNSQVNALGGGINAFEPVLDSLHKAFAESKFGDWPTVLLGTILQTTAISLYKLLPPPEVSGAPVDRRSIATLVRNLVDTHDSIDMLCNTETPEDFNLHRDILGYYLSGQIADIQKHIAAGEVQKFFPIARAEYWAKIDQGIQDTTRKGRLKRGQSLFYRSRSERIQKACGSDSDFVRGVIADLSTYVHSIPPALWMSTVESAFDDDKGARDMLALWVQVANFYYANSIRIVLQAFQGEAPPDLNNYLNRFEHVFAKSA